jgi:hypothetical protein
MRCTAAIGLQGERSVQPPLDVLFQGARNSTPVVAFMVPNEHVWAMDSTILDRKGELVAIARVRKE